MGRNRGARAIGGRGGRVLPQPGHGNGSRTTAPPSLFWGTVRVEEETASQSRLGSAFEKGATESVLIVGDTRRALARMPDLAFQSCVTSPPYWSLRNYHIEGQIGLENSSGDYIKSLTEVFR